MNELNKLVTRPDDFIKWRKWLAVAIVVLGGLAAYAAYMPYEVVLERPNMEWFLLAFFLVIIGNGYFIYEVFKVDEHITKLERGRAYENEDDCDWEGWPVLGDMCWTIRR